MTQSTEHSRKGTEGAGRIMGLIELLYLPNTPTLVEPIVGDRHHATETAIREIGQALENRVSQVIVWTPHFRTVHSFGLDPRPSPPQLFDFDFPASFRKPYRPPGAPFLAQSLLERAQKAGVPLVSTDQWGIDHGIWSPLLYLFPSANIPVLPLSVAAGLEFEQYRAMGSVIAGLNDLVSAFALIVTGSIVHRLDRWDGQNKPWEREARLLRERMMDMFRQGDWSELSHLPPQWVAAADPEGGLGLFHGMAGAIGPGFRAEILAQEEEFGAVSLDTVRIVPAQ